MQRTPVRFRFPLGLALTVALSSSSAAAVPAHKTIGLPEKAAVKEIIRLPFIPGKVYDVRLMPVPLPSFLGP